MIQRVQETESEQTVQQRAVKCIEDILCIFSDSQSNDFILTGWYEERAINIIKSYILGEMKDVKEDIRKKLPNIETRLKILLQELYLRITKHITIAENTCDHNKAWSERKMAIQLSNMEEILEEIITQYRLSPILRDMDAKLCRIQREVEREQWATIRANERFMRFRQLIANLFWPSSKRHRVKKQL